MRLCSDKADARKARPPRRSRGEIRDIDNIRARIMDGMAVVAGSCGGEYLLSWGALAHGKAREMTRSAAGRHAHSVEAAAAANRPIAFQFTFLSLPMFDVLTHDIHEERVMRD